MYGTAFRANNLPFQTSVTRSSWVFVCLFLQLHCQAQPWCQSRHMGGQKTGLRNDCALDDLQLAEAAWLGCRGVSNGQQRRQHVPHELCKDLGESSLHSGNPRGASPAYFSVSDRKRRPSRIGVCQCAVRVHVCVCVSVLSLPVYVEALCFVSMY